MAGSTLDKGPHARRDGLLLVAAAAAAMLVGTAHGRAGTDADAFLSRLDPVFAAATRTFSPDAATDDVDLRDGRSPVPARWQPNFERFARDDRTRPQATGGVVFVGSSSIDFWSDLPAQFPTRSVTQRGLPGATIADCVRHVDRMVLPSRPRVVVFYAGDNDLAAGLAPERVAADYADFVARVRDVLPATRIVFVSIKPSPQRAALMPSIRRANALMAAHARTDRRLDFVDVFDAMLDGEAHARRELFGPDGLHMSAAGYAIWRDALSGHLD